MQRNKYFLTRLAGRQNHHDHNTKQPRSKMMETLIVRAVVPADLRDQFDLWYEAEHLPEAQDAFGAYEAYRGWSDDNPDLHFALYRFSETGAVDRITQNGTLGVLISKFDARWQGRVTRTRDVIKVRQSLASE